MIHSKSFYDLGISEKCIFNQSLENKLIKNGYKTIAITKILTENELNKKGTKKKKNKQIHTDFVPKPITIQKISDYDGDLKILHRLTVTFSGSEMIRKVMESPNFKKYDIFAVIPMNQEAFQLACTEFDVDIISFDPEVKYPFKLSRKLHNLAIEKGIYFEIMYSPAIMDATLRKNIINLSHIYHSYKNSKNIIMTSWAINTNMIRGPYDLINLALVFGLTEEQSKIAITLNCKNLISRAVNRKISKSLILVKTIENVETMVIEDSDQSDMEQESQDGPVFKKSKSTA